MEYTACKYTLCADRLVPDTRCIYARSYTQWRVQMGRITTPNYPVPLLAELVRGRGKATPSQVLELVASFSNYRTACSYFEGQVYSLTHERDRLKAENEFLIRLINLKLEELQ